MSLDLVKCGMCGKAIVVGKGRRHVCDACREEEQALYLRVRRFLRDYSYDGLTISEVSSMMNLDERKITHLVDGGYFKLVMNKIQLGE